MSTTTLTLTGVSPSSGSLAITSDEPTGAFTDFAFVRGQGVPDPYISHILNQSVDVSAATGFVRLSVTATAPTAYTPGPPPAAEPGRAVYAGMGTTETSMPASGSAYLDHAQLEAAPPVSLLADFAEGYDEGLYYTLESGIGALWERSQTRTNVGQWSGHFLASPAYAGNTYQKVSNFSSYNQLLAANRTYADVLIGPS